MTSFLSAQKITKWRIREIKEDKRIFILAKLY